MQNSAGRPHDPAALFVDKINMNQLLPSRRLKNLPGSTAVPGAGQDAVRDDVAATGRANYPTTLLAIKTETVELGRRSVEFRRQKLVRLAPGMATVGSLKDTATCQNESRFLADKVDVIDRMVYTKRPFGPIGAAVFGIAEKTTITGYPTTFRVGEINSV